MSAIAADYVAALADCRDALQFGHTLHGTKLLRLIRCLLQTGSDNAASNAAVTTLAADVVTLNTAVGTLNTHYGTQMGILAAFTGASDIAVVVAAIATAKGVLDPDVAACVSDVAVVVTDKNAVVAAKPVGTGITANATMDGQPQAGGD